MSAVRIREHGPLSSAGPTENYGTLADCSKYPRNLLTITALSDRCGRDWLLTETFRLSPETLPAGET